MSDKALIMVRFIPLAKTHLCRQRSTNRLTFFVKRFYTYPGLTHHPSSICLTLCQADTLESYIVPGIYSDSAYKFCSLFLFSFRRG